MMEKTTILIVEDEEIVAVDLAGKLEKLGYEVVGQAATGKEAVEAACTLRPQIVLMDIWLKGKMDGIEAAEAIKSRFDVPIIYLTAHSDSVTLERAKQSGPFGYILKPFEERELSTAIEMALYRHLSDRQLREQRELLRVTLASIGDAVITCDTEGRVTFVNPIAEALTGWKNGEARGLPIQRVFLLVSEDSHQPIEDILDFVLLEGRTGKLSNRVALQTRDGREVPIEESVAPIIDAEDRVIGVVLVFHDITEKRRTQEALRLQQEQLRQRAEELEGIMEVAPVAIWISNDPQCREVRGNLYADQLMDVPRKHNISASALPGDAAVSYKVFRKGAELKPEEMPAQLAAAAGKSVMHENIELHFADGRIVHLLISAVPLFDDTGSVRGMVSAGMDISRLKQAEESLQNSEREKTLILDNANEIIAYHDTDHNIQWANNGYLKSTGMSIEDIKGKKCYQTWGLDRLCEECPVSRVLLSGRAESGELTSKNQPHWPLDQGCWMIRAAPVKDKDGSIIGVIEVAFEITEQIETQEELRQAKEAAEAANMAKSQFLANMSHELRTPMTGVLGMLDVVLLGNLEAEQRDSIETAQSAARSLVRILNDILDLTKIEAGKLSIEEKPFSPRKCLEDIINILLPVAKGKGLDLNLTVADNVPETLIGDRTRINQVLTNLAGNAVKFTDKGKVEIRVATGDGRADGKHAVTFSVTDTGIGIPAGNRELIFQSFTQGDQSDNRRYGGTGLGLAISKEIVERMGGTIDFRSEEGRGSTFFCTIPFGEAEAVADKVLAAEVTATPWDTPQSEVMTKPRLLVAEDDPVTRKVLGLMLQKSKYESDFAEDGEKAVEMWENGKYDIILMDVQMPLMNGFEATAAIRLKEQSNGTHTPIVAMTAHALKEDEERCLAAGMDTYISKPIDFKECLQRIGETLKKTGVQ